VALTVVPELLCVLLCLAGTWTDLRSRLIPNRLTISGVVLGIGLHLALGLTSGAGVGAAMAAAGAALAALCVFGVLGLMGLFGMGDAKLMAAVGACLGWPTIGPAAVYVMLSGGVVALAHAVGRGRLGAVLGNIVAGRARPGGEGLDAPHLHRMPYAVAILLGATWAIAARHWPRLALL
jgi:prepilin peptidase CpaA